MKGLISTCLFVLAGRRPAQAARNASSAEQRYLAAIASDERYCDAMDNLGRLYRTQNRLDEAIALYRRSITVNGKNAAARQNLGSALLYQHKPDEAAAVYGEFVRVMPESPEGWYGMGLVSSSRGDLDERHAPSAPGRSPRRRDDKDATATKTTPMMFGEPGLQRTLGTSGRAYVSKTHVTRRKAKCGNSRDRNIAIVKRVSVSADRRSAVRRSDRPPRGFGTAGMTS
jgi:hypothetical protein